LAVGLDRGTDIARVGKDSIDDEDFEILVAGHLHNNRIVGLVLVENVDLAIFAPRPGNDLVLAPLEHDEVRIPERSATDSSIRIIGHIIEAAKHDVVCDDVNQRIGVLSNAARHVVESVVVGCKHSIVLALVGQLGQELTTDVGRVNRTNRGGESGQARVVQRLNEPRNIGSVLSIGKSSRESFKG